MRERVSALLQHDMERAGIVLHTRREPPHLGIRAGTRQVEQILGSL